MDNEYLDINLVDTPESYVDNEYLETSLDPMKPAKQALQNSLYQGTAKEPDQQAKYLKVSQETGLPLGVVERNYDFITRRNKVEGADYDSLLAKSPGTSKFLSKPVNAGLAHDDIETLTSLESYAKFKPIQRKTFGDKVKSLIPLEMGSAVESGELNLAMSAINARVSQGLMDKEEAAQAVAIINSMIRENQDKVPDFYKEWTKAYEEEGADFNKAWQKVLGSYSDAKRGEYLKALKDFSTGGFESLAEALDFIYSISVKRPKGLVYSRIENLTRNAPGFLLGAMGAASGAKLAALLGQAGPQAATPEELATIPAAAIAGAYAGYFAGGVFVEYGAVIQEEIDKNVKDPTNPEEILALYNNPEFMARVKSEGLKKGVTTAGVDALFNVFAGTFLSKSGIKNAKGFKAKALVAAKEGAKELGVQTAGEMLSEAAGQVARFDGDITKVDPTEVLAEGVISLGTSIVDVALGTSRRAYYSAKAEIATEQLLADTDKSFKAIDDFGKLEQFGEMASESKLKDRSPEVFGEFVDAASDNATLYFQNDEWDSYWSSKGESPEGKLTEITGDPAAYHRAKSNNMDIQLDMKDYVKVLVGTEDYNSLNQIARTEPDGFTVKEARDHIKNLSATIKDIASEAEVALSDDAEVSRIESSISDQLVATGRMTRNEANINAKAVGRFFGVMAERSGQKVADLYGQYGLTIGGEFEAEGGRSFEQQYTDYNYSEESGDLIFNNAEANIQLRNEDMLNDLAEGLADEVGGEALEINTLEVSPEEQGQGIGSEVIKRIESEALKQGQDKIVLKAEPLSSPKVGEAKPENLSKLIKFYEKNGFRVFKRNEENAIMIKDLSQDPRIMYQTKLAERYDLSKKIGEVKYKKQKNGKGYWLQAYPIDSNTAFINSRDMSESDLESTIGKELTQKIINGEGVEKGGFQSLSGLDLKVGGEGMKGFYDNMLVKYANKMGKKFDAKVGETEVVTGQEETYKSKQASKLKASTKELTFEDFKKDKEKSDRNRTVLIAEDLAGREHTLYIQHYKDDTVKYSGPEADVVVDYNNIEDFKEALKGETEVQVQTETVHSIPVTDKMKEIALTQGFELFQEGKSGKITFGANKKINIDLLKNANPSTFIHESGHMFLEVFADIIDSGKADAQTSKDWQTILKFLGVESRDQIQVEQHEKWARATEMYFAEGKAPSNALKKVFRRFKTWILGVYRDLRKLNVELTDEVREVFDRMLATDEEIQDAQDKLNLLPLLNEQAKSLGMTKAQAKKHKDALINISEQAKEEMLAKVLSDLKAKDEATYKALLSKEIEVAAQQVADMRVYKVRDYLNERGDKLNKDSILKYTDKEGLKKFTGIYAAEGGYNVDFVASQAGYDSGREFIEDVLKSPPKKQLIDLIAKDRMARKYPDKDIFTDPGRLEDLAMEMIHNDMHDKLLETEFELLTNNLPELKRGIRSLVKAPQRSAAIRDEAKKIIEGLQIKNIRPVVYERSQAKARRLSGEAFTKGDFVKAYEYKQKEMINHYLYKEAQVAREDLRKAKNIFKKLNKKDEDLAKTRDVNFVNAARSLLSRFGLGKPGKTPESFLQYLKAYDPQGYDTMSVMIEAVDSPATNLDDMTYEEFTVLKETVEALWELAKSSKQIEIDGKKRNTEKIVAELNAELSKYTKPGDRPGYTKALDKHDQFKLNVLGAKASLRRVESWVDAMDMGSLGVFKKYIWLPISEATDQYRVEREKAMANFRELFRPIENTLTYDPINAKEINYEFKDKAELLGAMLHTGNDSNKQKLLRGREWATLKEDETLDTSAWDSFVNRMIEEEVLTKTDFDFMQGVWDIMESYKPMAQRAHKAMYGHYFDEITANEFTNKYGTYRGGYMPAQTDPNLVEDQAVRKEKESLEKFNNSFAFPTTGRGATKKRVEAYAAPLIFDLRLVPRHLDWVLRFSIIEPKVKDVSKIIFNNEFKEALSLFDPKVRSNMLVPWLQRAAQQKVEIPIEQSKGLWRSVGIASKYIRTNTGFAIMVGNVTNTLQQFTGFSLAALKVKPKYLRNAFWTYLTDGKALTESINEKSAFMSKRLHSQVFDIHGEIEDLLVNPTKYEKAVNFGKKHGYFLQAYTQNIVDNITWQGAYEQAIENGDSEKDAVRIANEAVRLTQGSFNAEDISAFETGTALQRMFTMFYSYFNMQANLLGTEYVKTMREYGVSKGKGRLLYIYTFGFLMPAFLSELIVKGLAGEIDEDDDDQYLDDYLNMFFGSQIRTGTAMFPFVGPAVQSGVNAANDKWYDDRISTSPSISMLESAIGGNVKNVKRVIEGKEVNKKKATRDALTAINLATGLPVAPLSRPIGYLMDVESGKAKPTGPIDFTRGLITGKSGE